MEYHAAQLQLVCRVSGRRFSSLARPEHFPVTEWKDGLLACFGVNVFMDAEGVHPCSVCSLCVMVMRRWREAIAAGRTFTPRGGCGQSIDWEPHKRSHCTFCQRRSTRGRPAGTKKRRRSSGVDSVEPPQSKLLCNPRADAVPPESSTDQDLEVTAHVNMSLTDLKTNANAKLGAELELSHDRFTLPLPPLECPICKCVADRAVRSPCCEQHFCVECVFMWLTGKLECPHCHAPLNAADLTKPTALFSRLLPYLTLTCDYAEQGCTASVPLTNLRAHVARCPHKDAAESVLMITGETKLNVVTNLPVNTPFTRDMEVALSSLMTLKNAQSGGQGRVELFTGGRRKVWHSVREGSVPSDQASQRTIRERTRTMAGIRCAVSGGERGAQAQMSHELQCLNKIERDSLLESMGLAPGHLSAEQALAMKADLRLPWAKLRKLMRWLRLLRVDFHSEAVMRRKSNEQFPFAIIAEKVPMEVRTKSGEIEIMPAPLVAVPNLVDLVLHYLSLHREAGTLTWHNGAIPASEIWVKLGGDHGGGTFKMLFQIANVPSPNSVDNTVPFCIFAAKDTVANLTTALEPYRNFISHLNGMVWHDKVIRIFGFGDYEVECKLLGLSGPSGVHFCTQCDISKSEAQQSPECRAKATEERTLKSLRENLENFSKAGSNLARAKQFYNVIRQPHLDLEPSQWVIPVLHLDLGIFPYIYDRMVAKLQEVDAEIAREKAAEANVECSRNGSDFAQCILQLREAEKKEKQAAELQQKAELLAQQVNIF